MVVVIRYSCSGVAHDQIIVLLEVIGRYLQRMICTDLGYLGIDCCSQLLCPEQPAGAEECCCAWRTPALALRCHHLPSQVSMQLVLLINWLTKAFFTLYCRWSIESMALCVVPVSTELNEKAGKSNKQLSFYFLHFFVLTFFFLFCFPEMYFPPHFADTILW